MLDDDFEARVEAELSRRANVLGYNSAALAVAVVALQQIAETTDAGHMGYEKPKLSGYAAWAIAKQALACMKDAPADAEPAAAMTTDYLGCEYISMDVANIEKIAAAHSKGPTEVVYLYAAPPAPSVAVKALEWESHGEGWRGLGSIIYDVYPAKEGEWWWAALPMAGYLPFRERCKSPEAAKAAAQANFEARIRSALSAQVQDNHDNAEPPICATTSAIEDIFLTAQVQDVAAPTSPGVAAIAAERLRQKQVEGWTPEHDSKYTEGELVRAAVVYAMFRYHYWTTRLGHLWPWVSEWFKPGTTRRNLEKAGALIAAEIDRLDALQAQLEAMRGVPPQDGQ